MFFLLPVFFTAEAASLTVSPSSGSHNNTFTADLIVDGEGKSFNAAQANVTLSDNLQITSLTHGNCGMSFLTTPTVANPSFIGVILGSSSKKCTVYSLMLKPIISGAGSIALSNVSVREYQTARELLSSIKSGTYTLTASGNTQTTTSEQARGTSITDYNVNVKVVSQSNKPLQQSTVILTPQDATGGQEFRVETDENGVAKLTGVPPGMYTMQVTENGKVLSERVINVEGDSPEITFGIEEEEETASPFILIGGMVVGLLLVIGAAWFIFIRKKA